MDDEIPSVYINIDEYDDSLVPKPNDNNCFPGPSGEVFPDTSNRSHYQGLHNPSYQPVVPKGGSMLPDIEIGNIGRYIQSMLQKKNPLHEEFKVNH